ncbi:ABC transporter permease [Paenibacillus sanguinis]|uniref:ABC transporter permease n=1 Tax=Paenibacillus sanguinis TaxID=225906 RepID=UPI00035E3997|nr:FtsX-like permease family protein [Paenibacillus sanguinis]
MRQIVKGILASKKIFVMLFIGFLLTIFPILIALSTQNYYDEHFYHSKNGFFNYYYSIILTNIKELDLNRLQEIAETNFENSSVITSDITTMIPEVGRAKVIGLLNHKIWSPPLIQGTKIQSDESNDIVAGKLISEHPGTIKLFGQEYDVKGITGKDAGRDLINVYNYKIYISLNKLPDSIQQSIKKQNAFQIVVRSNMNPEKEIDRFILQTKQIYRKVETKVVNEAKNYENEKNSREGVKEVLSYPYKLFLIALINCINVSYLWIFLKRKEISLRKALGASNLNLFTFIIGQLLVCAILTAICAILIQWLLSKLSFMILNFTSYFISLSFSHIVISILITLVISLITSIIPLVHIMKIEPAKALKE